MYCVSKLLELCESFFLKKKMRGHFPPVLLPAVAAALPTSSVQVVWLAQKPVFKHSLQIVTLWAGGASTTRGVEAVKLRAAFTKDESQGPAGRCACMCVSVRGRERNASRPAEHFIIWQDDRRHKHTLAVYTAASELHDGRSVSFCFCFFIIQGCRDLQASN